MNEHMDFRMKSVIPPIIELLRTEDKPVWTTLELESEIFGEESIHQGMLQEKRYGQIKRALEKLNETGTVDKKEMWGPGQTYKHYGWYLTSRGNVG